MGHFTEQLTPLWDWFWADPLRGSAAVACLIAIASTPLVFLILGRKEYLHTRRGRTYRKPEWWSVVCSMALVMGIPGIVLVLLVKSQYFDEDRYAFDPNETWSVIEQGRQYETAKQLSKAAEEEYQRLQKERQRLVEGIKELDQAMIGLRATADRVPPVAQSLPEVLESLAEVRKAVGVDAPQQLVDYKAPPIELAEQQSANPYAGMMMPPSADWANRGAQPAEPQGPGLSQAERETELASVPKPQKELAALLPLTDIPEGWAVGESGDRYIETFNADNLYEKINGRAESFLQYDVTGMAYSYYQPDEDDSGEVQLYIFDMSTPLNALGKYGTEKPAEGIEPLELGAEGYASGASVFFYAKQYYIQIVSTSASTSYQQFTKAIARRIANDIMPGSAPEPEQSEAEVAAADPNSSAEPTSTEPASGPEGPESEPASAHTEAEVVDPSAIFDLLPDEPSRSGEKYIAQDAFGYAFLSDVFQANYTEGDQNWQGFIRPYPSPEEARKVFDQYRAEAEAFGAQITKVETEAADAMFIAANFGLNDIIFVKGNALCGANGATKVEAAKQFATAFAQSLPEQSPYLDADSAD